MTRIVLTSDRTLMSEFRNLPDADFYACAPAKPNVNVLMRMAVGLVFKVLAVPIPSIDGVALRAPYGLRKLEAALLRSYKESEVVVADPDYVESFLHDDTTIVGINTMDPLGISPLTLVATYHGQSESFASLYFKELVRRIDLARRRKGLRFKIVVGGSGALELLLQPQRLPELPIDHVVYGEIENVAGLLFHELEDGEDLPRIIDTKVYNQKKGLNTFPTVDEIPTIVRPSIHSLVEVMRGCGRNCSFCEPNLRAARYYPHDKIREEILVNIRGGQSNAWLQSEDIFLYALEDHKNFYPNRDALKDLFEMVMGIRGVKHTNATHGTVAPAAADPELIRELSRIMGAGPSNWIGIQTGLETGSTRIFAKWMPLKAKPFSPEEWPDVAFEGTRVFNENYWYPVYTMITGFPDETDDDVEESIQLLERLENELPRRVGREKAHYFIGIFPFLNWGVLKGERPFDLNSMMTKKRVRLFELAYRHMIRELTQPAPGTLKSPWLNMGFRIFGPVGFYYLNRLMDSVIEKQLKAVEERELYEEVKVVSK